MMKKNNKKYFKLIKNIFVVNLILTLLLTNSTAYAGDNRAVQEAFDNFRSSKYFGRYITLETYTDDKGIQHEVAIVNSIEEASDYFRYQMELRKDEIYIQYEGTFYCTLPREIYKKAISYDDSYTSNEGDYLKSEFKEYCCSIEYNDKEALIEYRPVEYLSNHLQQEQIDNEVDCVLNNLNVYNENDYVKIKAVHDYIVNNVKYDKTYSKYSAYNAIIDKSAVCQGFASLTYKMLKELNVGVRIITGVANKKSPHAWNIVSINGLWYNLDTTWDENITETSSNTAYNYFLKSENDFGGHERDFEFKTDDFNFQYTMAQESFENKKYEDEDVNRDGIIDSLDLAEVASRYNYSSLDIGWDNKYDLNKDCIIDIYDIVKVSARL